MSFPPEALAGPLLEALSGEQPELYPVALELLAANPTRQACDRVAQLMGALEQKAPVALPRAIKLLARFDPQAYAKVFASLQDHKLAEVRRCAVEALGQVHAPLVDHFALLRGRLMDEDKQVRAAAYQAIRRATRGAPQGGMVAWLAQPLASANRQIYWPALELLRERIGKAESAAALKALEPLLAAGDAETRRLAGAILESCGDEQTLAAVVAAQGSPFRWLVCGLFRPENGNAIDFAFPPEREIDPKKTYDAGDDRPIGWAVAHSNRIDGVLDLAFTYRGEGGEDISRRAAYAAATIVAELESDCLIDVQAKGASALWLNGQKLTHPAKDDYQAPATLKKGTNLLLVKTVPANGNEWRLRLRVLDKSGKRLAGISFDLPQ